MVKDSVVIRNHEDALDYVAKVLALGGEIVPTLVAFRAAEVDPYVFILPIGSSEDVSFVAQNMGSVLLSGGFSRYTIMLGLWTSDSKDCTNGIRSPKDDPAKREVVCVSSVSVDGKTITHSAQIERTDNSPKPLKFVEVDLQSWFTDLFARASDSLYGSRSTNPAKRKIAH